MLEDKRPPRLDLSGTKESVAVGCAPPSAEDVLATGRRIARLQRKIIEMGSPMSARSAHWGRSPASTPLTIPGSMSSTTDKSCASAGGSGGSGSSSGSSSSSSTSAVAASSSSVASGRVGKQPLPPKLDLPHRKRVRSGSVPKSAQLKYGQFRQPVRSAPLGGRFSPMVMMPGQQISVRAVASPRQADVYVTTPFVQQAGNDAAGSDAADDDENDPESCAIEEGAQTPPKRVDGIIKLGSKNYNYKVFISDDDEKDKEHFHEVMDVIWRNYTKDRV